MPSTTTAPPAQAARATDTTEISTPTEPTRPITRAASLAAPLPITGPRLVNIVCGINLNCRIDARAVSLAIRNSEYNPKRFQAVVLRIREPRACALVFQTGKMQVLGTRSIADARLAARKFARMVAKLGPQFAVRLDGFNVQNLVAHVDARFMIRLEGIHVKHAKFCSYEPELFPGLIYRMQRPRVVIMIFTTGKLIMLGAKTEEELDTAIRLLYPVLVEFRLHQPAAVNDSRAIAGGASEAKW